MYIGFRLQCIWEIRTPYAALEALSERGFVFGLVGSDRVWASGGYCANYMMELQNRSVGDMRDTSVEALRVFQLTEAEPHGGRVRDQLRDSADSSCG